MINAGRGVLAILAGLVLTAGLAHAEPPPPPKPTRVTAIDGTYGFDVLKPKRACAKVTGALLAKLKAYRCATPEAESASGKPVVASCTARRGGSEYMLFAKAADCTEERETQLANGAGD